MLWIANSRCLSPNRSSRLTSPLRVANRYSGTGCAVAACRNSFNSWVSLKISCSRLAMLRFDMARPSLLDGLKNHLVSCPIRGRPQCYLASRLKERLDLMAKAGGQSSPAIGHDPRSWAVGGRWQIIAQPVDPSFPAGSLSHRQCHFRVNAVRLATLLALRLLAGSATGSARKRSQLCPGQQACRYRPNGVPELFRALQKPLLDLLFAVGKPGTVTAGPPESKEAA